MAGDGTLDARTPPGVVRFCDCKIQEPFTNAPGNISGTYELEFGTAMLQYVRGAIFSHNFKSGKCHKLRTYILIDDAFVDSQNRFPEIRKSSFYDFVGQ